MNQLTEYPSSVVYKSLANENFCLKIIEIEI